MSISKKAVEWRFALGALVFVMVSVASLMFFYSGYDWGTQGVKDAWKVTEEDMDGDGVKNIADMCCCKTKYEIDKMGCPVLPPGKKIVNAKSCAEMMGQEAPECEIVEDTSPYR